MEREPSSDRLYPERPGVKIERALETLQKEPEVELTPEAEGEVRQYEQNLTRGELRDTEGQQVESLEPLWQLKVNEATMYADYFETPEGRELWEKTIGTPLTAEKTLEIEQELLRTNY
jgi:hypothetical protein